MARDDVPEDDGPSQEWLASYADAMTLLLAFFIMMFAFALIDEEKFEDFKVGVAAALGVPDPATQNTDSILSAGQGITPEIGFTPIDSNASAEAEAEKAKESLAGEITPRERRGPPGTVGAGVRPGRSLGGGRRGHRRARGVHPLRRAGPVRRRVGPKLDNDGLTLLAVAADVLDVIENRLEIEGHTDDAPTGSLWPSNWELSTARASRVVRWMIEPGELPPSQLVALGLADTRPRDVNTTPEGRQGQPPGGDRGPGGGDRRLQCARDRPDGRDGRRGGQIADNTEQETSSDG